MSKAEDVALEPSGVGGVAVEVGSDMDSFSMTYPIRCYGSFKRAVPVWNQFAFNTFSSAMETDHDREI
jgi:hypothetical protein